MNWLLAEIGKNEFSNRLLLRIHGLLKIFNS